MASEQVLSLRAVNRALLARQLLLDRRRLPAAGDGRTAQLVKTIEDLVGLQAQAPFPPYYGLHSRLDGFLPGDLAGLITDRSVVRIALMRGTIHLVSARDCLPLRQLVQPVIERGMRGAFGKQLAGVDPAELAATGRRLVEAEPMSFAQLGQALAARWPDHPPAALAQGVRAYVPLVQVPPRAVWGRSGQSLHTSAEHWLGQRRPQGGPARPAPAAGPDQLARLVAEYDNLLLSHAERSRVVSPEATRRLSTINGVIPGSVLVDGFVAGMWRLTRSRPEAAVTIETFGPVRRLGTAQRDALTAEAERVLAFAAPDVAHDVRFAPLIGS